MEVLPRFRRLASEEVRRKSSPDDLVTEADLSAERAFRKGVREILPDAAFVGEETGASGKDLAAALETETCVVLDPVDGTWNFANGIAVFGMIVAVLRRGQTVFGLLYDPLLDDWVLARRGGGAWFGRPGEPPERLSTASDTNDHAGFLPLFLFPPDRRRRIADAMLGLRRATSLRCACHEYRLVAHGRADFVLNAQLKVWDHAAGVLAVTEAGGAAALTDGRAYEPALTQGELLVARSPAALSELRERFA